MSRTSSLLSYRSQVKSVTDGQSAFGEVTIKVASPREAGTAGRRTVAGLRRLPANGSTATGTAPEGTSQAVAEVRRGLGSRYEFLPSQARPLPSSLALCTGIPVH